ncbi:MAG: plasmid pRiA4b ORF-3 family protein, partial [Deltaproteobacteria bacterium]|nr:plasmid pRiA4b ORF-3 family protein [Deltaproteobacteria bacterium]
MKREIFTFKVALQDEKRIWRRIAVGSDQTLDHLHQAIFEAFDRFDPHLYSFYFPKPGAKGRARIREASEYTSPDGPEELASWGGKPIKNAAKTRISSLDLKPGQTFHYLFDFGDSWWHEIKVEQTDETPEKSRRYPHMLEKRGDSPPQYVYPDDDYEDD